MERSHSRDLERELANSPRLVVASDEDYRGDNEPDTLSFLAAPAELAPDLRALGPDASAALQLQPPEPGMNGAASDVAADGRLSVDIGLAGLQVISTVPSVMFGTDMPTHPSITATETTDW